jgi:50S ribosomal protein L16 3-hydroxylase
MPLKWWIEYLVTSLLTNFEGFHQHQWRKRADALGQVNIDLLDGLTLETLYELAQDDRLESRIIEQGRGQDDDNYNLILGPFGEGDLGPHQMLMIQNLESLIPAVSQWLSAEFNFLPRWRIEDVMATAAHQGGNCGAHFDQYDVFLVQIAGEKTWSLDDGGHSAGDLRDDTDIRLLDYFKPTRTLTQQPGDVLYIPPGVGHHGLASDNSITLSIGIRNPLLSEMASYLADMLIQESHQSSSLNDQLLGVEIDPAEVAKLGQQLSQALIEPSLMNRWYGCYMTEPRDPELLSNVEDYVENGVDVQQLNEWLSSQTHLSLELPARIAVQDASLFVNGEMIPLSRNVEWLIELQQQRSVTVDQSCADLDIIKQLVETGSLAGYPT